MVKFVGKISSIQTDLQFYSFNFRIDLHNFIFFVLLPFYMTHFVWLRFFHCRRDVKSWKDTCVCSLI